MEQYEDGVNIPLSREDKIKEIKDQLASLPDETPGLEITPDGVLQRLSQKEKLTEELDKLLIEEVEN